MISQHPEVEAKVLKELEELQLLASPEHPAPRQLEFTDLSKLTYLTCCIKARTSHTLNKSCIPLLPNAVPHIQQG